MTTETITCPSGLSGSIRGMKAREERVLADRKLARAGTQLDGILAACWSETQDPGPYKFAGDAIDWSRVLQGDRFYALLQLRVLSYGPEYAFAVPCDNRACRARIDWEIDLRELPVKALPAESRDAFVAGRPFETVLPDAGLRVRFRLLTGADERRLARLRQEAAERPISTVLDVRIEGIDTPEARDKRAILEDLSMADVAYLLGEFDRVDCGVETEIDIECPECGNQMTIELPFERGFFLPTRKKERARIDSCQA